MARNVKILKHFELPTKPGMHARLLCLTGADKGIAYFIEANRIVLGRGDQCDIIVKDIKSSREHAEVTQVGSDYVVTDLGSQNGIIVNDLKVKQHKLIHGEKLIIGKTVYKFGLIEVRNEAQEILDRTKKSETTEVDQKQGINPKTGIFILIFVIAIFILLDDSKSEIIEPATDQSGEFKEISSKLVSEISNRERREGNKLKEEMSIMFQRGLREYREKNYFRALEQFDLALSSQPNDALALFYRRKTIESLDREVDNMFVQARRDRDSLKYESASVLYCSIMRLLSSAPEDSRYKDAQKYFDEVVALRGFEKDEIACK